MPSASHRSLQLAAADGTPIPNELDDRAPPESGVRLAQDFYRIVIAAARRLQPPTMRYNCHGLVFASRRTNLATILAPLDLWDLLRRDGYGRVAGEPQAGDVAVYVDGGGGIEHTGIVAHVERAGGLLDVRVWSAWGGIGEFEHRAEPGCTPYHACRLEYWRLHP
jgi:CHAP domain-containing protein